MTPALRPGPSLRPSEAITDIGPGMRFGRLVTVERIGWGTDSGGQWWRLRCDCGATVERSLSSLRTSERIGAASVCAACKVRDLYAWKSTRDGIRHAERFRAIAYARIFEEIGTVYPSILTDDPIEAMESYERGGDFDLDPGFTLAGVRVSYVSEACSVDADERWIAELCRAEDRAVAP